MVVCCYAEITAKWSEQELNERLLPLPEYLRDEALRKLQWLDSQLAASGKLLLKEVLIKLGPGNLSLADLKYNAHHRPYFDAGIDFNIAHSGSIAICCATAKGKIGIDIELVKPIGLDDYTDYFTQREWKAIRSYPDQLEGFYDFWTRKEAVLKAVGTGFNTPLNLVDVSDDTVVHNSLVYYIEKLNIRNGYKCHIATTENDMISEPVELKF